jgi:HK97 family phage prohead protease
MEFIKLIKKEFKVYSPLTNKSVIEFTKTHKEGDSERILLEGIASTTNRDLHDEIVAASAIETMAEQASTLNIHANHWYGIEDVVGAIQEAYVEDEQLHIKFLITKKYTPDIKDLLDTGVRLGLSIGGAITEYDEKNRIINALELYEISLTPMPANWDTFGTVTTSKGIVESNCLTGACYAIVKTLDGESNMEYKEETPNEESSGLTRDDVIQLINEYMAEKEETIAQEITEKVESQLESIVEAKIAEALDEEEPQTEEPEEEEDETKAQTEEEDEDEDKEEPQKEDEEEDDEDEATKSFTPEMITEIISKGIDNALGDDFADKVASKMFNNLDKTRTNKGSKYKQFQDTMKTTEPATEEVPVEKTTYSTKETAEILMKKQKAANPIMAAAMKNLQ